MKELDDAAVVPNSLSVAAPELLASLEALVDGEARGLFQLRDERMDRAISNARAAIAKATR